MKPKTKDMHWRDERMEVGTTAAIIDRLEFHRTISLKECATLLGISENTIRRHFKHIEIMGKGVRANLFGGEYLTLPKETRQGVE